MSIAEISNQRLEITVQRRTNLNFFLILKISSAELNILSTGGVLPSIITAGYPKDSILTIVELYSTNGAIQSSHRYKNSPVGDLMGFSIFMSVDNPIPWIRKQ